MTTRNALATPDAGPLLRAVPGWLAGVDGGGSGTRARLHDADGRLRGEGRSGPSGLAQGVEQAWRHVQQAMHAAWAEAGVTPAPPHQVALSLGLAGAELPGLRNVFLAADPGYACCLLHSDAETQLAGAHAGRPGIVVAAGTGAVAAARGADGRVLRAGGWGFPVGDEGGGAWLGLQAVQHLQRVIDGRVADDPAASGALVAALQAIVGPDACAVLAWCSRAGQHAYAQLAPCVFDAAGQGDVHAAALLDAAAAELARLARAMLAAAGRLPVAVTGSIGVRLQPRWPCDLRELTVSAAGDSADGALLLLRQALAAELKGAVR